MVEQEKACGTCKHYAQFQKTNSGNCAFKQPLPETPDIQEGTWDDMSCPKWESRNVQLPPPTQLAPPEVPNLNQNPPVA
jgi:hypothetical protein